MSQKCYWCQIEVEKTAIKRCAQCLLVSYCSKDCQKKSWKFGHKKNCSPQAHASAKAASSPVEPFSAEWVELEVDNLLSKWMAFWRECFVQAAFFALDLGNHPPNRVVTHCMVIVVEPQHFMTKKWQYYMIIDASVQNCAEIDVRFPELHVVDKPSDFSRMRYVVILQNNKGEVRRVRCVMWNDRGLADRRNRLGKEGSRALAHGWEGALMHGVASMDPPELERKLGLRR